MADSVASAAPPVCLVGGKGCAAVQDSDYATLLGVPVPVIGVFGYLSVLAAAALPGDPGRFLGVFAGLVGAGFSVYLTYLELFEIEAEAGDQDVDRHARDHLIAVVGDAGIGVQHGQRDRDHDGAAQAAVAGFHSVAGLVLFCATAVGMSLGDWHAPARNTPAVLVSTGRSFGWPSFRKPNSS